MPWLENIQLSKWLPDIFPHDLPDGGLVDAANVMSLEKGLVPVPAMTQYNVSGNFGTTAAIKPLYAREFVHSNGECYVIVGTQTSLYRVNTDKTITDVSNGTYNATQWDFTQYGDWIIATNLNNNPQVLKDFDDATAFEDLAGSPPKAKFCHFENGHLVFGNLTDAPKTLQWTAFENVEELTQSLATGADTQLLADAFGSITGIEKYGSPFAIFFDGSIVVGQYIGAPLVYRFAVIEKLRGAIHNNLILSVGSSIAYWDSGDMYQFTGTSQSFGTGLRELVFKDSTYGIDRTKLNECASAYDQNRDLVMFRYTMLNGESRLLLGSVTKQAWTYSDAWDTGAFIFHPDGSLTNYPKWGGFDYRSGAWHMLAESTTNHGSVSIVSKEISFPEVVMVKNVKLNSQYSSSITAPSITVQHRFRSQQDVTDTTFTKNNEDTFNGRATGRRFRVKITGDGNCIGTGISSFDIEYDGAAKR